MEHLYSNTYVRMYVRHTYDFGSYYLKMTGQGLPGSYAYAYVGTLWLLTLCILVWGELWVDQRKKCADICDVAQVTDIRTLPN